MSGERDAAAVENAPRDPWSLPARVGFRFAASWAALNAIPLAFAGLGDFWDGAMKLQPLLEAPGLWLGRHVLGITREIPTQTSGSGDRTVDWLTALFFVCAALAATLVWSIFDRRRRRYDRGFAWLQVVARYALGLILLGYGLAKVFRSQFVTPTPGQLIHTLGEMSPMHLLWAFMGFSTAYTFFCGAAEVLAALLLWFRRTAMLGAMVAAAVMSNIVMLNFCYDVPVKLLSTQLLLISLFLLLPHARRLVKFLVLGRAVEAAPLDEPRLPARLARVKPWAKAFVLGALIATNVRSAYRVMSEFADPPERPALYGAWEIEGMKWQAGTAPLGTLTWRKIAFGQQRCVVRTHDDTLHYYASRYDAAAHTVTLESEREKLVFTWARPDGEHAVLDGKRGDDAITLRLSALPAERQLLLLRGFHFISEVPFNR